jgi:NAD(P)H-dependent FMN reductase
MNKISIILGSTRQGRQGERVARWVQTVAAARTEFQVEMLDLRDWPMPFYDQPVTPSMIKGNYPHDIVNRWAGKIRDSDGFVIVTPEYNHGYPPVLKNALDWLYTEWNRKPVAFVAYSAGQIAGARSVEQLRLVSIELQLVPLRYDILIPAVQKQFNEAGEPLDESLNKRLNVVLDHLAWWTSTLKSGRS